MQERWFSDDAMLDHVAPAGYPEVPARLEAVRDALSARTGASRDEGEVAAEVAPNAVEAAIRAVHDDAYVDRFRAAARRGDGVLDSADNPMSTGTWAAAWAAARCALGAADFIAAGTHRHAFAAVRPPGHHAERDHAMGFCFFANIAVAAQHLIDRHGMSRVAIVDFDVHHGNGTQHIFEARGDVLVVNLHQFPLYPGTGAADEQGRGDGLGATVNVPLAAGAGDDAYIEAFGETVIPALDAFRPEALLVSAGFDAWQGDSLGGMRVSEAGYRDMGHRLADAASRLANGRMLSSLEGGYDVDALGAVVTAYLDGAADRASS